MYISVTFIYKSLKTSTLQFPSLSNQTHNIHSLSLLVVFVVYRQQRSDFYVSISEEDPGILPVNFRRLIVWGVLFSDSLIR